MNGIKGLWIALCMGLLFAGGAWAGDAAPRVSAYLTTGVAKLGAPVEIVVVVEGSLEGKIGSLPTVKGLAIGRPRGPSTESSMRSVGGRMSIERRATWRIPIKAGAAGDFQIPPFKVTVGQETFETQPMQLRVREDLAGAELGYMQLELAPKKIVVGQPFDLTLTFGWDAGLAAKINHADLSLPWWGELAGAIEIEGAERGLGGRKTTVGLNGDQQIEVESLGRQQVDGRDLVLYRLKRSFLATAAGSIELPVSHVEFGRVSGGSIFDAPRVIEMYYKSAPAESLAVAPLPEAGRPIEFGGAVGTIEAYAKADRREVELGDSIKVKVTWSGDGNLEFFDLPDLTHVPGFDGLRLFGVQDELKSRSARVSVFDLAPTDASLTEIPPIPLVVYDPEEARYKTVATRPIPIRVHALEGTGTLEELDGEVQRDDIRDIVTTGFSGDLGEGPEPMSSPFEGRGLWLPGSAAGLLVIFGLLRPRVRRGLDPGAPLERRRRRAERALSRALRRATEPSERQVAFAEFLGARTRTSAALWQGRRVGAGRELQLTEELLGRLDQVLEALEEAVWNPHKTPPNDGELLDLARELVRGGL